MEEIKPIRHTVVTPICRFKYLFYTFIDFLIIIWIISEFNNIRNGEVCGAILYILNSLTILPYLIAKRAKDINFSIKCVLALWYICTICPIVINILIPNFNSDFPINIFNIPIIFLQMYLILSKGHYDSFDIVSELKPLLRKILFLDYIQNLGVKRLCSLLAIILSVTFFFTFSKYGCSFHYINWCWEWNNFRNALIGFYLPFVIFAIIQWIYNGFKSA